MAAAFRAKTRLCPVLETQYTQNPRTDESVVCYRPGYRWSTPQCRPDLLEPVPYTITVIGPTGTRTFSGVAVPGSRTSAVWASFSTEVFELYGNDPVIYGTLLGLRSNDTGLYYPAGTELPARSGSFTPFVSFS